MSWVRLDDGYPEHPKVDRVGPLAAWLNVCAWAYCARHLTDGFVPLERVPRLARVGHLRQLTGALLSAQLWEPADRPCPKCSAKRTEAHSPVMGEAGVLVHDYLDFNPSRERVLEERAAIGRRVRRWRNAHTNGVDNAVTNAAPGPARPGNDTAPGLAPPISPPQAVGTSKERRRRAAAFDVGLVDTPEGGCPTCAWHQHEQFSAETRCLEHEPNEMHMP